MITRTVRRIRDWAQEEIDRKLNIIISELRKIMTTTSDIEGEVATIAADVATISTGVTALAAAFAAAQAASGDGSVSATDAATIMASLQGVDATAKQIVASLAAAVPPPPEPAS